MYCKGTVTVFFFFFFLLSYRGYLYRSLSRVPFCISVELNQMSQGRDTKSQLHRVQRRLPVPLSRRSVDDFQFWAGLKNVWECLSLNWNWAVFFFFFKCLICWNVQWLTNPLSVQSAAPVWRKCVFYMSAFLPYNQKKTLFWMGVICEPTNVCKYCTCIWKEKWNILPVIFCDCERFFKKICKENVHNMIIQIYSEKNVVTYFFVRFLHNTL